MEQEISLREIIEVILQGKWIIATITAIAIVISGVVSFFILSPTYEARTTLMVNSNITTDLKQISLTKYTEQVKNHAVMRGTIEQLNLQEQGMTINGLRDKINTEIIKDTNLIRVSVKDTDPELASQMANIITNQFVIFTINQEQEQQKKASEYTLDQIQTEINADKAALAKLEAELASTPEFIITNKSLSQDSYLQSVAREKGAASSNAAAGAIQFQDEEPNPLYLTLQENATNLKIEIEKLEGKKAEILDKTENNSFVANENVIIVSPAIAPESPIAPKKALNVAIAGVVGVMISIFVVFFRHYWLTSASSTPVTSRTEQGSSGIQL